jgi:hypothetical protein
VTSLSFFFFFFFFVKNEMATTAWLHFRLVRYILLFISLFISMYYFPGSNVWGLDRHARVVASSRVISTSTARTYKARESDND